MPPRAHRAALTSTPPLNAKFAEIQAAPDSGEMWYGHPFRMGSSYLWFRPMHGLTTRPIPIFLAQGTADTATPVEGARAMRDQFARLGLTNLTYEVKEPDRAVEFDQQIDVAI